MYINHQLKLNTYKYSIPRYSHSKNKQNNKRKMKRKKDFKMNSLFQYITFNNKIPSSNKKEN